ncbi:putative glycoside hydrolase, partial [Micrococcus luteus]|uniref:putative glycoside hydrolase n=1 Tax=Micrococcus luteus TaxID=1270 RepID=UPI00340F27E5
MLKSPNAIQSIRRRLRTPQQRAQEAELERARAVWRAETELREALSTIPQEIGPHAFDSYNANPEIRGYNIALAAEAAKLGFDDIMYDYVRRPDGPLGQMRFPG